MALDVRKNRNRTNLGQFRGRSGELNGLGKRPFYHVQLLRPAAAELLRALRECQASGECRWYTLMATAEDASRLRLTWITRTPAFEAEAARHYVRGDVFRINGRPGKSCNIDFSSRVGAGLLARELGEAATAHGRSFELRVRSRNRSLVEFLPDVDLEAAPSSEHDALARAGEAMAAESLAREDFSDWEADGE